MKYSAKEEFDRANVFGTGESNEAYSQYFSGNSYLNPILSEGPIAVMNVTFEPGCRNNWHIHHGGGQTILCTAGVGWAQIDGEEPVRLTEGSSFYFPAGVKHWHGAAKDSWFSHIAFADPSTTDNEWLEPVSDLDYTSLS